MMVTYSQYKCDPSVTAILIKLREEAGLTQEEAGAAVGLAGSKSRDSVRAWESGMSVPRPVRRPDFLNNLLDRLRLRRDPAHFEQIWDTLMVGQWGWDPLSDEDRARCFPGRRRPDAKAALSEPGAPLEGRHVDPPRPTFPPNVDGFVGRERQQSELLARLETCHRLVLTGIPGAGKTWLGAMVAIRLRAPDAIFWHSFRPGEDGAALIWRLAGFLYWRGRKELWLMLQRTGQGVGTAPPLDLLVDYLVEWLPRGGYLLCLDNFQCVDEDTLVGKLLDRLAQPVDEGNLSLLLTSRRIPPLLHEVECEPVEGLSQDDASELLVRQGVDLPRALFEQLHVATEGNPEALRLAAKALGAGADPQRLIAALAQTEGVTRYLMSQVDNRLSAAEREVMIAIALLGRCTREAVEALSDAPSVSGTLRGLQDSYLLHVQTGDEEREYELHPLLRSFYLDVPTAQRRTSLHILAGEHFERAGQAIRAASHFLGAQQHERAALLAISDVWRSANRGQLHLARQVLSALAADGMPTSRWAPVWTALGQVYALLRETPAAQEALDRAYRLQCALPDSLPAREQKAIICRHMGELLKFGAPREALEWLERGLTVLLVVTADPTAEGRTALLAQAAALRIEAGSVYSKLGEFPAALRELEQGLAMLPDAHTATRAAGLINLGIVYCTQGKTAQGVECYRQSIDVSEQLGDYWRILSARHNLAIEMDIAGDWVEAAREYRDALALAEQLGSRKHQVQVGLSLGILETKRGDYGTAGKLLTASLEMARQSALRDHVIAAQSSLAQLELRRGAVEAAGELLAEAEALAAQLEARDQLAEIWRGQAEVELARGRTDEALAAIGRSTDLARELGLELELGMSQSVLGQVLSARGEDARVAFEAGVSLLNLQDPYETARSKARWGFAMLAGEHSGRGTNMLWEARTTFQQLGAVRDAAAIDEILRR